MCERPASEEELGSDDGAVPVRSAWGADVSFGGLTRLWGGKSGIFGRGEGGCEPFRTFGTLESGGERISMRRGLGTSIVWAVEVWGC